jgi:hypothetical protein
MILNLSSDIQNVEESISTARFAQRCAKVANEVTKNETLDLNLVVKRLEYENAILKK